MKSLKNLTLIVLGIIIFSACSFNKIQRHYVVESSAPVVEVYINTSEILYEPVYMPSPEIVNQTETAAPITKERTNNTSINKNKKERETANSSNVRNNSGQRNTNSRGK